MNKTHRPCITLSCVFAAGIAAGKSFLPLWAWLLLAVLTLMVFPRTWAIYACLFCLGAVWISQKYLLPPESIAFLSKYQRAQVQGLEGVVDSDEAFDVRVQRILMAGNWHPSAGKVKVSPLSRVIFHPHYGQALRLHGKIHPAFDGFSKNFSYRRFLQQQGIYWMFLPDKTQPIEVLAEGEGNLWLATCFKLRRTIVGIYKRYLNPREAGFVAALVLGDRAGLPKDLKEIFINTGTAHILAISGMNMAVVSTVFLFILRLVPLPRQWQFLAAAAFLFVYACMSGWSASVVRACLMSAVVLAGFAFEEEGDGLNSLGLAAIILLFLDPSTLWDIGFQLSVAAVFAIMTLAKPIEKIFVWLPVFLRVPMAISLAAWTGTAGLLFLHFHTMTPVAIVANLPIVPLADAVMALGLGLAAFGWCPWLAYAFAACLKVVLSTMIIFAQWFNAWPGGHFVWQ